MNVTTDENGADVAVDWRAYETRRQLATRIPPKDVDIETALWNGTVCIKWNHSQNSPNARPR